MNSKSWSAIFDKFSILEHNFNQKPYLITAQQIKDATTHFKKTNEKEVRILCKQDSREDRPSIFVENGLFILPKKNGEYVIVRGEGYVDIPEITTTTEIYKSKLDFELKSSKIGNSEMQHLDFAYASSLIRTFLNDDSLVLTIRGRKYTPKFSFRVNNHIIETQGVQTEVDAGYEGRNLVALVEAKNSKTNNVIIRQLFYPLKQWSVQTQKRVVPIFFEKRKSEYLLWAFEFSDIDDYNSIRLVKSNKYIIV